MKTHQTKAKDIRREWHLVDVKQKILGRVASDIAQFLIGKQRVNYVPHLDMGDYVVVINAKDVEVTGKKAAQKIYYKHSGYPGGFKEVKYSKLIKDAPEKVIQHAVKGMLPKNRLQKKRMTRLRVFAGSDHEYKDKLTKLTK